MTTRRWDWDVMTDYRERKYRRPAVVTSSRAVVWLLGFFNGCIWTHNLLLVAWP
jgi:hypothetical protein